LGYPAVILTAEQRAEVTKVAQVQLSQVPGLWRLEEIQATNRVGVAVSVGNLFDQRLDTPQMRAEVESAARHRVHLVVNLRLARWKIRDPQLSHLGVTWDRQSASLTPKKAFGDGIVLWARNYSLSKSEDDARNLWSGSYIEVMNASREIRRFRQNIRKAGMYANLQALPVDGTTSLVLQGENAVPYMCIVLTFSLQPINSPVVGIVPAYESNRGLISNIGPVYESERFLTPTPTAASRKGLLGRWRRGTLDVAA